MKSLRVFLLSIILFFAFGRVLTQEVPLMTEVIEAVNLDVDIRPEDLGISEPKILPDSPFYFLKNWVRWIQQFLALSPVKKAELRLKFANEKLMEAKRLIEEKKNPEIIKKAIENYQKEIEKMKSQVDKIKEKVRENPKVESFLDKFIHQQTLHQKLLDRLETQVPSQAFEKIKEARERHLERFKDVMLKLEDRKEKIAEKLDKILEKQRGSEFKEFKNLEVLKRLEEKVPEEAKEVIRKAQERIMERLQKKLEVLPTKKQEQLKIYIEKISGEKEKHLEIMEEIRARLRQMPSTPVRVELKEKLEQGRTKIVEKLKEKLEKIGCPLWTPPAPGFCKEGRIIIEKDPKTGCPLPPKCIIPGEFEIPGLFPPEAPIPTPITPGLPNPASVYCISLGYKFEIRTNPDGSQYGVCIFPDGSECEAWAFYHGKCGEKYRKEVPEKLEKHLPKEFFCPTLWDPVCGKDGKTYSNECFAKLARVEIEYKGVCKGKEQNRKIEERKRELKCQSDKDCIFLICPQVVGMDTPRCNLETNTCYCGAKIERE